MVFSYNWLQSFFRKKLPQPEKLAELLTLHSFEVSTIERSGQDWILDVEVLPNRAGDCFSHLGIARECSVLTNSQFTPSANFPWQVKLREDKNLKAKDFLVLQVKQRQACQRYTARVILDVKVGPSPKWIRERLEVCGLKPINNIVDIANYLMLETGQPLHAFDFEKLETDQHRLRRKIIVRFSKENEKIVTLDNEKYDLDKNILVIADEKEPLAIAGIKGGKKAEITSSTKIVVLESANFNPQVIRRGSRLIDLKTDASWRFEHGLDPNLTEFALNRAACLIKEMAGGRVAQGLIDFYPQKVLPKRIKLDLDYPERLLGIKIPIKRIKEILKKLGFKLLPYPRGVSGKGREGKVLVVEIPTFRLDISLPEDLIEEVGRISGYQKIPSVFPIASLIPPERNLDLFWEDFVKNILKEAGFFEVYNYSFISEKEKEFFPQKNLIEIENPISSQFKYLRPSLIPHLLNNIQKNQKNFREIKIFELGKIFMKEKEGKLIEKRMLTGAITAEAFKENKWEQGFYQLKGVIDLLLNKMGMANLWYDFYQPSPREIEFSLWDLQKSAEVKVGDQKIGFLGEILKEVLETLKIEKKVVIFEIDFEKLKKLASEEQEFRIISPYPAAIRDMAILVPREILVEEVLNKIEIVGGKLIRDIDLFDLYEGEEIPEGKKSLAFHIVYQAEDRVLTSEEIDKIQEKIIKSLEENPEWVVRK